MLFFVCIITVSKQRRKSEDDLNCVVRWVLDQGNKFLLRTQRMIQLLFRAIPLLETTDQFSSRHDDDSKGWPVFRAM